MNKRILKLAIPNIISNITIPLLGMIDTSLMGHLDSLVYVGAIALGSMIFNFIYWGMGFLRMGTLGFVGQALGSKNHKEISLTLYRVIGISLLLSFILLSIHPWIIQGGLSLTESSFMVKNEALAYFNIRIWALPASLIILSLSGWFIGMQNTFYPMIISIASNILNIGFSVLFVFHFNMKTEGVALGTLIAQYLSLLLALILFSNRYKSYIILPKRKEIINEKIMIFMNVNKDIFIRTLGIIFVFSFFTIRSANISDSSLAVNTILFQFFIFFSYMLDGFANAGESLSAEAIGSKSMVLLQEVIKRTFKFGLIFSLIFTLIYALFGEYILLLLTNNEQLLQQAAELIGWVILMPLVSFQAFIYDGIYVGATASKTMRNTMILATLFVFVPILYWGYGDEVTRLWSAFLLFMLARGVFLMLSLKKSIYIKVG